jgi:hypothetical protein
MKAILPDYQKHQTGDANKTPCVNDVSYYQNSVTYQETLPPTFIYILNIKTTT